VLPVVVVVVVVVVTGWPAGWSFLPVGANVNSVQQVVSADLC